MGLDDVLHIKDLKLPPGVQAAAGRGPDRRDRSRKIEEEETAGRRRDAEPEVIGEGRGAKRPPSE